MPRYTSNKTVTIIKFPFLQIVSEKLLPPSHNLLLFPTPPSTSLPGVLLIYIKNSSKFKGVPKGSHTLPRQNERQTCLLQSHNALLNFLD